MAKKNKEDWADRFVDRSERFAERMTEWADKLAERMEKKHNESKFSYNTSIIKHDGKTIAIKSTNKHLTITVDGKEVYRNKK